MQEVIYKIGDKIQYLCPIEKTTQCIDTVIDEWTTKEGQFIEVKQGDFVIHPEERENFKLKKRA